MPNQITDTFHSHRDAIVRDIGRAATDNTIINKIGKAAFGDSWAGAHPWDKVVIRPHSFYVVNTDSSAGKGQHWVGLHTTQNRAYIYDSYGRNPKKLLPRLVKKIHHAGYSLGQTGLGHRPEQIGYTSEVCGQDSLAFLMTARDLGIHKAALL